MNKSWCLIIDTYEYIKQKKQNPASAPYFFYDSCFTLSLISFFCFMNIIPILDLLINTFKEKIKRKNIEFKDNSLS